MQKRMGLPIIFWGGGLTLRLFSELERFDSAFGIAVNDLSPWLYSFANLVCEGVFLRIRL